jgi:aspartyl-tRNA(Asn)/glutamyl-tRNA(Gln) amidotransferase subunit C
VITPEDVEHVARLARLALSEAEKRQMRDELASILAYIDTLQALDTEGVEPTAHVLPVVNVMREDEPRPCLPAETMLANAPDRRDAFVRVPRILED